MEPGMANHAALLAKATLLELVVRTAFVRGLRPERHMTDWPTLRYFSRVGPIGRTRPGLANYLGVTLDLSDAIVARLQETGDLGSDSDTGDRLKLTQCGWETLAADPARMLSSAIETLPESAQDGLADYLETILTALGPPAGQGDI
jgi:hypothetical protein